VYGALGGTPYWAAAREVLTAAAQHPSEEQRGLAAERGGALLGVLVYGVYAGAAGAGRLHLVLVAPNARRAAVGTALLERAAGRLRTEGARFLLAEVPDDAPLLGAYRSFLFARDFFEEARVPDLVREGVALTFLRRPLR
jgi:GNAT superfamily N-acetyltransferase